MTTEQTILLVVEAKPRQARLIPYIRLVDTSRVRVDNGHLYLRANGTDFRMALVHRYEELEQCVQQGIVKGLKFDRTNQSRIWKAHVRVLPRHADAPGALDGIMGLDVGTRAHLSMYWTRNGRDDHRQYDTGCELSYAQFNHLGQELYATLVEHGLHTLRIEDLGRYARPNEIGIEFVNFLTTYVELASGGAITVERVNPLYTSQVCPRCHQISFQLIQYRYCCHACHLDIDRNLVAAMNVQRGGLHVQENAS